MTVARLVAMTLGLALVLSGFPPVQAKERAADEGTAPPCHAMSAAPAAVGAANVSAPVTSDGAEISSKSQQEECALCPMACCKAPLPSPVVVLPQPALGEAPAVTLAGLRAENPVPPKAPPRV